MEKKRLRNLTTGKLHTEMGHIYEDLETITGIEGLMTHMLPNAMKSAIPWLKKKVTEDVYWDNKYTPEVKGHFDLPRSTEEEKNTMQKRYAKMPSGLKCIAHLRGV